MYFSYFNKFRTVIRHLYKIHVFTTNAVYKTFKKQYMACQIKKLKSPALEAKEKISCVYQANNPTQVMI